MLSQPAFTCTEMISSKALLHQPKFTFARYVKKDSQEGPVCFQLSGNDSKELSEAAKIVTDQGADLIDLNCGCPVKKIRKKGLGSSLLGNAAHLYKLITALKQASDLPVSIKIRVDRHSNEKFNAELVRVVEDAGLDFLIVHGRHWTENYDTPCSYEEIKFFVESLNIPVIGNGDVACEYSLKQMFATGCAGVMLSRAGVGQPWLIKKLISDINKGDFSRPSLSETGLVFFSHIDNLSKLFSNDKFTLVQARKLIKYYARGVKNKIELMTVINQCTSLNELKTICSQYFTDN
jgi:tRNA-dihydrouridine synthase B